jgi:hypothetical protein
MIGPPPKFHELRGNLLAVFNTTLKNRNLQGEARYDEREGG